MCQFGGLPYLQINTIILDTTEHYAPIIFASVDKPMKTITSILDVIHVKVSESHCRYLVLVNWVLIVKTYSRSCDLILIVETNWKTEGFSRLLWTQANESLKIKFTIHRIYSNKKLMGRAHLLYGSQLKETHLVSINIT